MEIAIRHLNKIYDGKAVLDIDSLHIPPHENPSPSHQASPVRAGS